MDCPVCKAAGLPDSLQKCPQCESDLEAFQLIRKIEKSSVSRLWYGLVSSALLVILLIVWALTGSSGGGEDNTEAMEALQAKNLEITAELQKSRAELEKLAKQNSDLNNDIEALRKGTDNTDEVKKKRQEGQVIEHTVENGETLYSIALKFYKDGFRYADIARDNNIPDPNLIRTGQKLIINNPK